MLPEWLNDHMKQYMGHIEIDWGHWEFTNPDETAVEIIPEWRIEYTWYTPSSDINQIKHTVTATHSDLGPALVTLSRNLRKHALHTV